MAYCVTWMGKVMIVLTNIPDIPEMKYMHHVVTLTPAKIMVWLQLRSQGLGVELLFNLQSDL